MKKIIHKAESRKFFDYGLLKTYHSFSFSSYYDPEKMNFGLLRVLNDDYIAPNFGFDLHPHKNMEIITVILDGKLRHGDNQGNTEVIDENMIQVMSAGSGIYHSEFNPSDSRETNLLQIWIIPKKMEVTPRYDILRINPQNRKNKIDTFASPERSENIAFLNQDAYLSLCDIDINKTIKYEIKFPNNCVYFFVIEGMIDIEGDILSKRDAAGISETEEFSFTALDSSRVLIIDVPENMDKETYNNFINKN